MPICFYSWVCLRSQKLDTSLAEQNDQNSTPSEPASWCSGSDAWGDDDDSGCHLDYLNEFTRNNVDRNGFRHNVNELNSGFSKMTVEETKSPFHGLSSKDCCVMEIPSAVAMIEGGEGDTVCVDTPTLPTNDISVLFQTQASLPSVRS